VIYGCLSCLALRVAGLDLIQDQTCTRARGEHCSNQLGHSSRWRGTSGVPTATAFRSYTSGGTDDERGGGGGLLYVRCLNVFPDPMPRVKHWFVHCHQRCAYLTDPLFYYHSRRWSLCCIPAAMYVLALRLGHMQTLDSSASSSQHVSDTCLMHPPPTSGACAIPAATPPFLVRRGNTPVTTRAPALLHLPGPACSRQTPSTSPSYGTGWL